MSIVTREQIENTRRWVDAFFKACDSFDVNDWITDFFQPDATIHLGNHPVMQGHEQIIKQYEGYYSFLSFVEHTVQSVDISAERCYVRVRVASILKNDPEQLPIVLEGLMIIGKKSDDEKLDYFNVYIDSIPLLRRFQMCM
ncbi:unnamed protein product [Adineta ricciae]|uniref:SnoaL-like domain-containing protein n=1 Tax=Adineta ricciae TaxID=249248 RepID=A0A813NPT4_ADIRI|nr:unnamed protein product [Adineta ricciae]CAF0776049.1 unnamed protein product [Adineta ricciae]